MSDAPSPQTAVDDPFALGADEVIERLGVDRRRGLPAAEVARRRERYGRNELPTAAGRPAWLRFADQFNQLVVWILIVAAVIAGASGDALDAVVIVAIVVLNAVLGFVQEERAERALESLKKLAVPTARVVRDGDEQVFPASELVPGDLVRLEAGDSVPADARLIEHAALTVEEAALTGESLPVDKDSAARLQPSAALGDRTNMVYFGTTVAAGKGSAVVTATGAATELGHIAGLLARQEREPTPMQRRLAELGRILVVVCLAIVALIGLLLYLRGLPLLDVLLPSVSLAVAAVPEGLPAVVTVTLALGLQRLVKRNALIRKLPGVETLGSVTVICTDKTGTLTRNEMTVRELVVGDVAYSVSGAGYAPHGEFKPQSGGESPSPAAAADLVLALTIGACCNNAKVVAADEPERWNVLGDPTEGALTVAAAKHEAVDVDNLPERQYEIPFDSTRKVMSVACVVPAAGGATERVLYVKGAAETVLERCTQRHRAGQGEPLDDDVRAALLERNAQMAGRALRVLGLAYRRDPPAAPDDSVERDLTFVGLVGMIDPPRDEVRDAVAQCRRAGIRPVMITGDHPRTAAAIAAELGLLDGEARDVLSGNELDALDDDELQARVATTPVFARVSAEHKLRVVQAWKRRKQIVAMTGDGVNDAPAVKTADIGIAMGITGTDVTKEASDMVLTDDNFASIVSAVEEGRGILDNILKVIHYLLSCNAGEVLLMLLAAICGLPVPLTALQILWINLVTDGLPALALAVEPPEPNLMSRPPRRPDAPLISWKSGRLMLLHGASIAASSLGAFVIAWHYLPADVDGPRRIAAAQLTTFCVTAFAQLFFALSCRSRRLTSPQLGWLSNLPLLSAIATSGVLQLLMTYWLVMREGLSWSVVDVRLAAASIALSLFPVTAFELGKLANSRRRRGAARDAERAAPGPAESADSRAPRAD